MHVTERIRAIKLLNKLAEYPEMAERLGISYPREYLLREDGSTKVPVRQPVQYKSVGSLCGLKDKEKVLYV